MGKEKREKQKKGSGGGFGLRLAHAVIFTVLAILFFVLFGVILKTPVLAIILTPICLLFAIIGYVGAFVGVKQKWANVLLLVFCSLTCVMPVSIVIVLPGILGATKGINALKAANKPAEEDASAAQPEAVDVSAEVAATAAVVGESVASPQVQQPLEKGDAVAQAISKTLEDFPVDYENKPTVSAALDFGNNENLVLTNEEGLTVEFAQRYITVQNGNLYLLTETVGLSEEEGGGAVVFRVDYAADTFYLENDDNISQAVFDEYKTALKNSQTYEKQSIKRSDFKLDLYDTNVDEKTWKQFKKTATQDELTVIAIGAKYRIAHSRIKNLIYALGIVLSIALFWPTGGWSLIGYPVFAFLATKSIRYEDTYSQSYRKLSKENRAFVDGYFNSNVGLTIVDTIIKIVLFWITIPYQAILLLIGMFAPNFVISKNGILVSIPKGYDVGGLGAVGAYYESFSFIDEALANGKAAKRVIKIDGNEVTEQPYVIDDRGQKVYKDANGNEYVSDDGGKTAREYHRYD